MKLSERILCVNSSPTIRVTQKAKEMRNNGIDIVSFGAGEPNFDTPDEIKESAKKALDDGFTKYAPTLGLPELRTAIAENISKNSGLNYDLDQIIVTCGAKSAILLAMQVVLNPGDEVIIPSPYWVSYPEQVKLASGTPKIFETQEVNEFKIRPDEFRKAITEKTKMLILNTPSNPTGSIYTKAELEQIVSIAIEKNIIILADEIYDKLTFSDDFCSVLNAHPEAKDHTIYINGVSKTYAMTGWRMGYAATNREVIKAMAKYQGQLYTSITTFVQKACITALGISEDTIKDMVNTYKSRRDFMLELLSKIPHISAVPPKGAFYVFVNISSYLNNNKDINTSQKLAEYLLEKEHVAVIPGSAFGKEGYIRLSFATSSKEIEKGIERIAKGLGTVLR